MKKLNLVFKEKGNILYDVTHFPDGQQQVRVIQPFSSHDEEVTILARLNNWRDLELLHCTVASLRNMDMKKIHLYCPYIVGGRSDRKFKKGSNNYLKQVISPVINILDLTSVTVIDPHSDCMEMGLDNLSDPINNSAFVGWALADLKINEPDMAIVCPDGGALKKIYTTLKEIGYNGDLILANKHREITTGKITHFEVPLTESQKKKTLVWVDDILDGGGTFIGEANEANKNGHTGKKYLLCTHSIFSAGYNKLAEHFEMVYTTNSYADFGKTVVSNEGIGSRQFVKQQDVF